MRIAIDGSDLAAERVEGPSVYAGALLPLLTRILADRGHTVSTYTPGPLAGVSVTGELRVIPGASFWTQRVLAAALRRDPPEVLFLPIQALPLLRPRRTATVAVVHDLEFLKYPETYTRFNLALLRFFTRDAALHARKLIAVSQYTKNDVVRVYGRRSEDVSVVHHGVDTNMFREETSSTQWFDVRTAYRLPDEPYILFVGTLQPRKNIGGLVRAFEDLSKHHSERLVLVSGGEWKSSTILRRIERSRGRARIHVLRRVPPTHLAALYRHAQALVLPSFSEGFGLPVLEAMAAGVPVVASNTTAIPEIGGDAVRYVNPHDPNDLTRGIEEVLQDEGLRRRLIVRGSERSKEFTWEHAAARTAEVIETAS